jgi:formylglycine-generating enzyme required for sulfatase activity
LKLRPLTLMWIEPSAGTYSSTLNFCFSVSGVLGCVYGGAWNGGDPSWVRPTYRFKSPPTLRSHGIGFRCAKDLKASR